MRRHLRKLVPLSVLAATAAFAGAMLGGTGLGVAATQAAPSNQTPPTVKGTAEVGSTLTASDGTWTNNPTNFTYSWRRCDADGGSCSAISGAIEKTYVLKAVDKDNTLRVRVTARNADGSATATSVPTSVIRVAAAPAPTTGCARTGGTVPIGELSAPERLLIDRNEAVPSVVGRSTDSVTMRVRVSACNGKPVNGALVFVTFVPYNQFTVPQEQATGDDGWATLRMSRLGGYPATPKQQLLVAFVRARKPGESLLGGVSTRRLVSFRVDLRR
jgi:hypothetical protein